MTGCAGLDVRLMVSQPAQPAAAPRDVPGARIVAAAACSLTCFSPVFYPLHPGCCPPSPALTARARSPRRQDFKFSDSVTGGSWSLVTVDRRPPKAQLRGGRRGGASRRHRARGKVKCGSPRDDVEIVETADAGGRVGRSPVHHTELAARVARDDGVAGGRRSGASRGHGGRGGGGRREASEQKGGKAGRNRGARARGSLQQRRGSEQRAYGGGGSSTE